MLFKRNVMRKKKTLARADPLLSFSSFWNLGSRTIIGGSGSFFLLPWHVCGVYFQHLEKPCLETVEMAQ